MNACARWFVMAEKARSGKGCASLAAAAKNATATIPIVMAVVAELVRLKTSKWRVRPFAGSGASIG